MNKRMTGVLFFCFWVLGLPAQLTWERNVLATSGSTLTSGPLTVNLTMGEAIVGSFNAGANALSTNLGFQQGNLMLTGIEDWALPSLPRVYPNPFHHTLTIDVELDQQGQLALMDARGESIHLQEMNGSSSTTLRLADLPAGSYILKWLDLHSGQTSSLILIKQ